MLACASRRSLPLTAETRDTKHQVCSVPVGALARQQHRIGRHDSALVLQGRLLAGIRSVGHLLDFKHGGGLHDVLHAAGIVDARKLHQNLVLPEPVRFNGGLADAESVNAIADGIDGLGDRLILQVSQRSKASSPDSRYCRAPPVMS